MKKFLLLISILFLLLLSACGSSEKDFLNYPWGASLQEVLALEEKNGNVDYTEKTTSNSVSIEYEDIMINGLEADVEFIFVNSFSGYDARMEVLSEIDTNFEEYLSYNGVHNINDLSSEEEELYFISFEEKNKKLFEEFTSIPDDYYFDTFRLVEGILFFWGISSDDSQSLLDSLENNYGEATIKSSSSREGEVYYTWDLDRVYIYFNGTNYISYEAKYASIKDKVEKVNPIREVEL